MSNPPRSAVAASPVGVVVVRSADAPDVDLGHLLAHLARHGVVSPPVAIVDPAASAAAERITDAIERLAGAPATDAAGAIELGGAHLVGNRGVELLVAAVASAAAPSVATLELLDDYALVTARRLAAVIASDPAAVSAGGAAALAVYPGSHFAVPAAGAGGPPRARPAILDFATVRRLRDHAVEPGTLPPEAISAMARRAVEGGDGPRPVAPRFWIDESELEAEIRHGERARVRVRGWVLAEPMPRRVVLRVGGREVARGPVEVRRPDLLVAGTELEHDDCGFELEAAIGPLPVGRHEVVWGADGTDLEQGIGSVRVLPVLSLEIDRVLVPRSAPRREPLPVLVEGRAVSSQRSPRITVRAGGRALEVERRRRPAALDSEPDVVEFVASGTVEPRRAVVAGALEVHARAKGSGDAADRRRKVEIERLRGGERWVEIERRVGPFDPRLGGAPVAIRGVLFGAAPGTRVTLEAGGAPIAGATAVPIELAAESLGAASFAIESPALSGIDPELAELALLAIAPDGAVRRLERWSERTGVRGVAVRAGAPGIAAIPGRASLRRVVLEGELEGAERVSSLALAIDGVVRTRLGGEWLEPAEASAGPAARFHRFRFDAEMPLESGTRRFEIRVRRRLRETAVWSAQVEVPETGIEIAARLRSTDLDRLLAEDEPVVRSRLAVEGEVIGDLPAGASVRLILDGAPAASSPLDDDGSFRVSARPTPGATVEGALEVVADGAVVERSPAFRARMRPLVIPDGVARDFRSLLPRLLPAGEEALGADAGEILLRLHERDPGSSGRLRRAIAELGRRAAEAARAPGEVIESIEAAPRRLRVLFAAWEVPCERHGGGVCMVNLLRHLGERHEVTLIHAEAPGEEGLSETVRPFVREILTARREWQAPTHDPAYGTPRGLAWSQSPRLRRAIEAELASGGYDLVNYEYTEMCDHVAAAEVPALGALYELHSFGRHASAPGRFEDPEAAAAWLGETIATLAWEAGTVARRFRELVVLTRPEAEFFARWLPGRRIWVSPIPVAVPSARAPEEATAAPLFVFVGNFIHPPNREAAERLSREIAPRVLEARPDARFVIAGPDPPVALTALARPGVIDVPGFVADLDGLLAGARAFVAPIRSGGGMRVKVLDAMARGAAVVTTALGSNGIEAVPGREILLADSTEETVAALVALAAEPERARALGRAARERVAASYGVAAMGERRDRIWRALAAAGG